MPLGDIMEEALMKIESIGSRSGQMPRPHWLRRPRLNDGLHRVDDCCCGPSRHGKLDLADFARSCSVNNTERVLLAGEMALHEIAMRLLSAEARVALHHMRSGNMTDDDGSAGPGGCRTVYDAPLIDDSPNLSMMEIRPRPGGLKQRNDLRLVVIDYLQLMQAGGSRRPEKPGSRRSPRCRETSSCSRRNWNSRSSRCPS